MPVELLGAAAIVVGYFMRPVSEWLGLAIAHRTADIDRRRDFQFQTLQSLSTQLERWRYAGDTVTAETAKSQVEILIFKVKDDKLRELVELMIVTPYSDQKYRDTYGDVVRRLGAVIRDL